MKIPRFIKLSGSYQRCPECGENTLLVVYNGDMCQNCGYNVYYP